MAEGREVRAAGMQLLEGEAHTRAGRVIEASQRVGYLACDLHGEGEHPCVCLRYRNSVDKVGNVFLDAQYESSPRDQTPRCAGREWTKGFGCWLGEPLGALRFVKFCR